MKHNTRTADLAKIHIARKDLRLDDDTYTLIIKQVGRASSGSAADLDVAGRARVLEHFQQHGWKPKPKSGARSRRHAHTQHPDHASVDQVGLVRHIWIVMADAGVVRDREESALRAWIKSSTSSFQAGGYDAPELLPYSVAQHLIERLKRWAKRSGVTLDVS